jgi:hypothetical protein
MKIKNKKAFKKFAGKCAFCEERDYAVLDVHRIFEGFKGGSYDSINSIVTCANCHRKIHAGNLKLVKKHINYGESLFLLEYIQDNETKYLPMKY